MSERGGYSNESNFKPQFSLGKKSSKSLLTKIIDLIAKFNKITINAFDLLSHVNCFFNLRKKLK
jgi:hypothetical protein